MSEPRREQDMIALRGPQELIPLDTSGPYVATTREVPLSPSVLRAYHATIRRDLALRRQISDWSEGAA